MAISKQVHTQTTSPNSSSHAATLQSVVPLVSSNNYAISNHEYPLKIPVGNSPYVRAKQVQLVERNPERAIALFWAAINAGDRVDSALKDMAVVMKQQNRCEEAIQAILSFRHLCSSLAQESLDNVLLDLYKKCGRLEDQIELLKHKLSLINKGMVFNGKRTKTARSQGKKFQISIRQEATRLLGNLGWAYMQLCNYVAAEAVYRKALTFDADNNKLCNLGVCLLKQCKYEQARVVLEAVTPASPDGCVLNAESHLKSYERSRALLQELQSAAQANPATSSHTELPFADDQDHNDDQLLITPQEFDLWTSNWKIWESPSLPNPASCSATEISDNPAAICANPGLKYPKISSTLDPILNMQESKEITEPYNSDDFNPILSGFTSKHVETGLGCSGCVGVISPTNHKYVGSFKRDIGPSSTVHHSKAKKNTHDDEQNGGADFLNFSQDNHIHKMGADWVSPTIIKRPVARRLVLEGSMSQMDEKNDNRVACSHRIVDSVEPMDVGRCSRRRDVFDVSSRRDVFDVIDQDLHMDDLYMSNARFNGRARQVDGVGTTILDFSCVDKVIESIVPDAPSASQSVLNINADIETSDGGYGVDNLMHHTQDNDEILTSRPTPLTQGESMESLIGIHQHRLKVFQMMTYAEPSCAISI